MTMMNREAETSSVSQKDFHVSCSVSDLRIIEDVIAIVMMMKLLAQLLNLSLGLLALHSLSLSKKAPNISPAVKHRTDDRCRHAWEGGGDVPAM